ncbi:MAG: DUF4924 family protein [Paludibacteraceae bacterium]|jgi:hypothetical protein|nr:DUF4924 family protein [Paludibacteraceae bacterium]MEE0910888.1 DUF4924 family protein [Paludibacteraceae bacterium]
MIIAKQKKEENIVEYLLYMWQIEDILRAYKLDIEKVDEVIVSQYQQDEKTKKEIREWYDNLIQMMKLEHLEESGHLQININLVNDLNDLHIELLQNPQEIQYNALFFKTLPFLVEFRSKLKAGEETNDIQLSLHSLYAILLLKLQKKEISKDTEVAVKQISSFLAVLSQKYKHWLEEEPQ